MQRIRGASRPRAQGRSGSRAGTWFLLVLVALALRVGYAWVAIGPDAQPYSDSADYDTIARNLASGRGYSSQPEPAAPHPTAFRPPVVPWLTSLVYRAVGHHFFGAVLLQCLIGALIPPLLVALGAAMFGSTVGWSAGWLAAFHPLLVFFSGYLLTETAFAAAMLLALFATVEWMKTPRPGRAAGVGMAWGLAALTRPTAMALPALIALWAWVPLGLTVTTRERARQLLLLALGIAVVVAPWTIRNAIALRAFVPVTTGGGRALLDANNPLVWNDPRTRGGAFAVVQEPRYAAEFRGLGEPAADALAARRAWEFLRSHAREWPAMAAAKLARFWRVRAETATTGSWQRAGTPLERATRAVDPLLVWSALTLPLAGWGAIRVLRGPRRWFQSLGLLVILYFTGLGIVYWGALRMRVPIEPLVMLLAAVGLEDARRRLRARASGFRLVEGHRRATPGGGES
jgi:4-amino-4-deoxy-L-arabinose transferase-like glycosyltransferase